jgi:hypothetical protein
MEEKVTYEEAQKAREVLLQYLKKALQTECFNLNDYNRSPEAILYLALNQEFCLL